MPRQACRRVSRQAVVPRWKRRRPRSAVGSAQAGLPRPRDDGGAGKAAQRGMRALQTRNRRCGQHASLPPANTLLLSYRVSPSSGIVDSPRSSESSPIKAFSPRSTPPLPAARMLRRFVDGPPRGRAAHAASLGVRWWSTDVGEAVVGCMAGGSSTAARRRRPGLTSSAIVPPRADDYYLGEGRGALRGSPRPWWTELAGPHRPAVPLRCVAPCCPRVARERFAPKCRRGPSQRFRWSGPLF
ncbi:MAG: hypothetical protein JWN91_1474 [Nocardioides sp.]|nr:hypothetical protein [Nocardioides sp.]